MANLDHTRHSGIFNVSDLDVTLIGAGGIGAITAITLGKMGVGKLHVIDDDTIDDVNIATQFHRVSDIGLKKVVALSGSVLSYANLEITTNTGRIKPGAWILPMSEIFISSVDSIASRQAIWPAVCHMHTLAPYYCEWYLDARMGAEIFELFTVKLNNGHWYDRQIEGVSDEDFPDLPCTSKATIYTACIAAGHIGAAVRRIVTGKQRPGLLTHNIVDNHLSFLEVTS